MNSIIQCLVGSPRLRDYFTSDQYFDDFNSSMSLSKPQRLDGYLVIEFGKIVKKMWSDKFDIIRPARLMRVMGQYNRELFATYGQQDPHEFLVYVLDGLHQDLNRVIDLFKILVIFFDK